MRKEEQKCMKQNQKREMDVGPEQTAFCFVFEDPAKGSTGAKEEVFSYKQSENNTQNNKVREIGQGTN